MRACSPVVFAALVACSLGWEPLVAEPAIDILPSPHPQVKILPVDGSGSSTAVALLASEPAALRPVTFFVSNETGQPILSMVVRCSAIVNGNTRTCRMMMDAFQTANDRPVLQPGERLLFAGTLYMVERELWHLLDGSAISTKELKNASDWLSGASSVTISIDSIILADGEVWGPDTEHVVQELTSRKNAADAVRAAIAAGDSAALSVMAAGPPQPNDEHLAEWKQRFAARYLAAAKDPAGQGLQLQILTAFPTLPHLFPASAPKQ